MGFGEGTVLDRRWFTVRVLTTSLTVCKTNGGVNDRVVSPGERTGEWPSRGISTRRGVPPSVFVFGITRDTSCRSPYGLMYPNLGCPQVGEEG